MIKEKDIIKYIQENVGMIDLVIMKDGSIFCADNVKITIDYKKKVKA